MNGDLSSVDREKKEAAREASGKGLEKANTALAILSAGKKQLIKELCLRFSFIVYCMLIRMKDCTDWGT